MLQPDCYSKQYFFFVALPDIESDFEDQSVEEGDTPVEIPPDGVSVATNNMTTMPECNVSIEASARDAADNYASSETSSRSGKDDDRENVPKCSKRRSSMLSEIQENSTNFVDDDRENVPKCSKRRMPMLSEIKENCINSSGDDGDRGKMPPKHQKRRWNQQEMSMLLSDFGKEICHKKLPSGKRIAELAGRMQTRTIAQIRTQIHNYISGKLKLQ